MKALIVSETEETIKDFSKYLLTIGYDSIGYRWLMKALDNVEEISPQLVIINAMDYPRHWKTFIQFLSGTTEENTPKIILVSTEEFAENELRKSKFLGVKGIVTGIKTVEEQEKLCSLLDIVTKSDEPLTIKKNEIEEDNKTEIEKNTVTSKDIDELRKTINELASTVLKQKTIIEQDKENPLINSANKTNSTFIEKQENKSLYDSSQKFTNELNIPKITEPTITKDSKTEIPEDYKQNQIEVTKEIKPESNEVISEVKKENRKFLKFMFSNPKTDSIILGKITNYTDDTFDYDPTDLSVLSQFKINDIISNCTLKTDKGFLNVTVKIIGINTKLQFQIIN